MKLKIFFISVTCFFILVIFILKNMDVNDYGNQIPEEERASTVVTVDAIYGGIVNQSEIESIQLDDGTYLGEYDYVYILPDGTEITKQTFLNKE